MVSERDLSRHTFAIRRVLDARTTSCTVVGICGDHELTVGDVFMIAYRPERAPTEIDGEVRYIRRDIRTIQLRIDEILLAGHSLTTLDPRIETLAAELRLSGLGTTVLKERDFLALA